MILQNISKAIREQNYYAVALEFVIVLLGVVIGFQINAWNEARSERGTENLILCRLAPDFAVIDADVREHRTDAQLSWDDAIAIVEIAEAGMTPEQLEDIDIDRAIWLRAPPAGSPTYAQLVSCGDMALVSSESLREALVTFHETLARFQRESGALTQLTQNSGSSVFDLLDLTIQDVATYPDEARAELERRLASLDFILDAIRVETANETNFEWKASISQASMSVMSALAEHAPHCETAADG